MNFHEGRQEANSIIHVLIANLTVMVAEMLQRTFQQQSDIKLLGNVHEWEGIDAVIAKADILVLGVDDVYSLPEACFRWLGSYPKLKILLLAAATDEAIAYWRILHCHSMQITSSQALTESIRQIYSLSPF